VMPVPVTCSISPGGAARLRAAGPARRPRAQAPGELGQAAPSGRYPPRARHGAT
jgi:hypothetical protein